MKAIPNAQDFKAFEFDRPVLQYSKARKIMGFFEVILKESKSEKLINKT